MEERNQIVQSKPLFRQTKTLVLLSIVFIAGTALGLSIHFLASNNQEKSVEATATVSEDLPIQDNGIDSIKIIVGKKQNLSNILKEYEIASSAQVIDAMIKSLPKNDKRIFRKMREGDLITMDIDKNSRKVTSFEYLPKRNFMKYTFISDDEGGFSTTSEDRLLHAKREIKIYHGSISKSFYEDGLQVGMSDNLIISTIDLYKWGIDFINDIRANDSFSVMVENLYLEDNTLAQQNILASKINVQGKPYKLFRFTKDNGDLIGYYNENGASPKGHFLRMPVSFARISSRFSMSRLHPALHYRRPHLGVDFAAPRGTPIFATADGVVSRKRFSSGYGRHIVINHGKGYSTLYGHMSRFRSGIRVGSRVKQKQIIGYVGSSGLATGPHVHYEFRVNGVHRNPLRVHMSYSLPSLKSTKLKAFKKQINSYKDDFENYINKDGLEEDGGNVIVSYKPDYNKVLESR